MDPVTLAMIASSVGAPLIGSLFGAGNDARAREQQEAALAEYLGISVPELRELAPQLLGQTNLAGVSTDPRFDAYQDEALARLSEKGRAGGLDATARARMEEARLDAASQAKANRESILSSARARGTLGTGEELTAMLQSEQASADRERMAGLATLSDAEERALQAISATSSMAGERQARQWNQRAQVATAQDRIDEFNASTANDFARYNDQQRWQQFDGSMRLADGRSRARLGMADYEERQGERDRQMWGGIGQGVTYGLGSGAFGGAQPGANPAAAINPAAQPAQAQSGTPAKRRKVG